MNITPQPHKFYWHPRLTQASYVIARAEEYGTKIPVVEIVVGGKILTLSAGDCRDLIDFIEGKAE